MNINRRSLFSIPAALAASRKEIPKLISEVKTLHIGPDDIIVYRTDSCLSCAKIQSLNETHEKHFSGIKAMVLTDGMDVGVIRREK